MHPLQEAFSEKHALQCGFCTPGFLMSLMPFLEKHPDPSEEEIREAIDGNLCRCTGYQNMIGAVKLAAKKMAARQEEMREVILWQEKCLDKALQRNEDPYLLTGKAEFIDDIELPGMLHAAFLRCDYAHARIKSIDVSAALQAPGCGGGLHRRGFRRLLETRPAAGAAADGDQGLGIPRAHADPDCQG